MYNMEERIFLFLFFSVTAVWLWSSHLTSLGTNFPPNRLRLGPFRFLIPWLLVHEKAFTGCLVVLSGRMFWDNSYQVLFPETHRGERVEPWGWPVNPAKRNPLATVHQHRESGCAPNVPVLGWEEPMFAMDQNLAKETKRVLLCYWRCPPLPWNLSSTFRLLNSNSFTVIRDDAFAGLFHLEYL